MKIIISILAVIAIMLCGCTPNAVESQIKDILSEVKGTIDIKSLNDSILRNKNNPSHYYKRGVFYVSENKIKRGLEDLSIAISFHSEQNNSSELAMDYFVRSMAYFLNKDYSKALKDYEQVEILSDIEMELPYLHIYKIELYNKLNRYEDAEKEYEKLSEVESNDEYLIKALLEPMLKKKQYDKAIAVLSKTISKNNDYENYYLARADIYNKIGNKSAAIDDIIHAIKCAGLYDPIVVLWDKHAEKDYNLAIERLTLMMNKYPDNEDFIQLLKITKKSK